MNAAPLPSPGEPRGAGLRSTLAMVRAHPLRALKTLASCRLLLGARAGYLGETGWFRTMLCGAPVGADGEPIPWITYPSLCFLESRVRRDMAVFEFGAGSSTVWWARRVARVVSCEHERQWLEKVRSYELPNVETILAVPENEQYSGQILRYSKAFDIVVIDGEDRVKCAMNSINALKDDGVIVWDNSDRDCYEPGFQFLRQRGFRRLDFSGIAPLILFESCTSLLYRDHNCLGL